MLANILFYGTFLSQIFLLSVYFPGKILGRMNAVLKKYPPLQYPKLYPQPLEDYKLGQWKFKWVNRFIVLLGFIILYLIVFVVDHANFADHGYISVAWPAAYGAIQFVPLVLLEFSELGQLKLMRKASAETTRKAILQRRRLADFVAPMVVGTAISLFVATIVWDLYVHDFVFQWGHDTIQRAIVLTVSNLFLAAFGAWHLHGKKLNPHQAHGDRTKHIAANLNSLFYLSMTMSIYFMATAADDVFDLDFLQASLLSLYFQAIAFLSIGHILRTLRVEDMDFEVYKADVEVT